MVCVRCVGRFLERQGLLERDAENSYLAGDAVDGAPLDQLLGHPITYRVAVGPHQGRKVFTLQTLPDCNEPSLTKWTRWRDFHCMRGSQPGWTSARNWNVYAATLQGPRCRKSGCRC